ncbi:Cof-type HAD-IIB family hydrolase [Metasolibacillus sp. FSL H7-0170]|uniref:Cof-type HAD-IIB family hydrolase n=1 Tax=Metasolibacillus TaxID=2703677 RepID=UPI00079ADECF|nr:Cof-type HAD-IIB family hydrolase [Metasolibacillus fluoroglycofenilyticus]KYG89349.1 hydrolase Cof [[Bacillus] sp. KCTC 13219]
MKKILFFDVDGTLYNSEKNLPSSAKEALLQARANGYELAIATGRAPFMIEELLEELAIDTYVTLNGQYVVHKGEVIFSDGLSNELLEKIIQFSSVQGHPVVFIDDKQMVASMPGHEGVRGSLATLHCPYPQVEPDFYKNNPVYQTLLFMEEHEEAAYAKAFPNVQFVRWHSEVCDILPQGGSKARGIQKLVEKIGYTMENTIAFGDGLNDIEMLQAAGIGVAMGNSHPEVKKVADVQAPHVDEDGLYKAMKELGVI